MSIEIEDLEMKTLSADDLNSSKKKATFTGLTKDELMKIEREEKFWGKLRIGLFVLFWLIWAALLIASIIIVVFSKKCPYRAQLNSWDKSCVYRLNPFAFQDTNGDRVGDLKGVQEKLTYVKETLGSKTYIIDPIFNGEFGEKYLHATKDFYQVDPQVGTLADIRSLAKESRKQGDSLVLTIDINSVAVDGAYAKKTNFYVEPPSGLKWLGRNGNSAICKYGGKDYYTSMGADSSGNCVVVDLNFQNPEVRSEIKNVLNFWLSDVGVGGILLTNVAFLQEDFTNTESKTMDVASTNPFFKTQNLGQVFCQNSSTDLLAQFREAVEEANKRTSKKKLLMVETGDLGYVPFGDRHPILSYASAVDVVLLPNFLYKSGWKSSPTNATKVKLNLQAFYNQLDGEKKIGKSIADPYHLRHKSLLALAGVYLLPGVSVIYQGTELGMMVDDGQLNEDLSTLSLYPKAARSLSYLSSKDKDDKDLFLHAAMPWDTRGEFSSNITSAEYATYVKAVGTADNVLLYNSVGAPQNYLTLTKALAKVRSSEAILWGNVVWEKSPGIGEDNYQPLIISRYAAGFPKVIIVHTENRAEKGIPLNLNHICNQASVSISYPLNSRLPDGPINMDAVYIDTSQGESLHVFTCV